MIVLVANLGSTSFKYKLFDITSEGERVLAQGSADRIGQDHSSWAIAPTAQDHSSWAIAPTGGEPREGAAELADHGAAIELHLRELTGAGVIESIDAVDAIGFKAVHGGPIRGAVRVDDEVLETMERFADVAPAHNPPYIAAMGAFAEKLPDVPQVAAFETGFHQTIPPARQTYAIPHEWTELGVRRYGFHGASHRYIATRVAEIAPDARKVISCHLGGSSSISAVRDGESVANSFGMTAQSGLPHAARVGDFDAFALLKLHKAGIDDETIWRRLSKEGGLLGISGVGQDVRDIKQAADHGNERARLALDVLVESVRQYIGAYLAVLNGADAVCFTAGIGQHNPDLRAAMLADMDYAGISVDLQKNEAASGHEETRIDGNGSRAQVWVLPTNEELIVARQTVAALR